MHKTGKLRIMVAGVGGASLGTELMKCLQLAGRYEIYGCDISPTAYGLYDSGFSRTFVVDPHDYLPSVIRACTESGARWIIPGGEQPMLLLAEGADRLAEAGIGFIANDPDVIQTYSDKSEAFKCLAALGVTIPKTVNVISPQDLEHVGLPCIVKPATGTGGSAMVFYATDTEEAMIYAGYIRRAGGTPLAQEYLSPDEGEFTVGVLSLPNGELVGSIALRRALDAKLSIMSRSRGGLVSSGYSQGYIADFPAVRRRAEDIARAVGSTGALNIQGRVRNGELIPFEINPRLSASTYLRAMAGFNEVDLLLQYAAFNTRATPGRLREGWYLRSLTERYVAPEEVKS